MKPNLTHSVFKRRWFQAVGSLALLMVVGLTIVAMGQGFRGPGPTDRPTLNLPEPPPVVAPEVLENARTLLKTSQTPDVDLGNGLTLHIRSGPATRGMTIEVAGSPLKLPNNAELDGIILKAEQRLGTGKRLPLPHYLIIRGNEMAVVSKKTGEFQIGDGTLHQFQFLVDKLGVDKMQLVERSVYDVMWGPHQRKLIKGDE